MNDLCAQIGYLSLNHSGEELCGDHVEVAGHDDMSKVIVLADGLGSGVKASILSTLTAKIISTMMASGLSLEDCVETIADTLPVCQVRGLAYATFTILHVVQNECLEIIRYDNPPVLFFRHFESQPYEETMMHIGGKSIYKARISVLPDDLFIAMSDGCPHAGTDGQMNLNWGIDQVAAYIQPLLAARFTPKTLAALLLDEVNRLYGEKPGDDATCCVVHVKKREPVNVLFGPPENPDDNDRMMSLFFSKEGRHIICGGTTALVAARYLGKELRPCKASGDQSVPPISELDGVDLVTEGVVTMDKVLGHARDYLSGNKAHAHWGYAQDGASLISRLLFEEATDIHFFVGKAVNPAHQNPDLPIRFHIKMNLIKELSACLMQMGKRVKASYF